MRSFGAYRGKMKKGLGLILFMTVAVCTAFGSVHEVKAASALVTEDTVKAYNNYMASVGIDNSNNYSDSRVGDRARALMEFSNGNGNVLSAKGKSLQFHTDTSYRQYKDWKRGVPSAPFDQELYMMEFASNQDASTYYDCSFSIIFEQNGYVRWTSIKDLDDEATEFLDYGQFKKDRCEQVTFTLPSGVDSCPGCEVRKSRRTTGS